MRNTHDTKCVSVKEDTFVCWPVIIAVVVLSLAKHLTNVETHLNCERKIVCARVGQKTDQQMNK